MTSVIVAVLGVIYGDDVGGDGDAGGSGFGRGKGGSRDRSSVDRQTGGGCYCGEKGGRETAAWGVSVSCLGTTIQIRRVKQQYLGTETEARDMYLWPFHALVPWCFVPLWLAWSVPLSQHLIFTFPSSVFVPVSPYPCKHPFVSFLPVSHKAWRAAQTDTVEVSLLYGSNYLSTTHNIP